MGINPLKRYTQSIIVEIKAIKGYNSHNYPEYATTEVQVDNCLVSPQQPVDLQGGRFESTRYEGHLNRLFIWIPKYCDVDFFNTRVKVNEEWYKVKGSPERYHEVPEGISWNLYIIAEKETG